MRDSLSEKNFTGRRKPKNTSCLMWVSDGPCSCCHSFHPPSPSANPPNCQSRQCGGKPSDTVRFKSLYVKNARYFALIETAMISCIGPCKSNIACTYTSAPPPHPPLF